MIKLIDLLNEIKVNQPLNFPKDRKWTYIAKDQPTYEKIAKILINNGWELDKYFTPDRYNNEAFPVFIFGSPDNIVDTSFMYSKHGDILNINDDPTYSERFLREIKINNPNITPKEVQILISKMLDSSYDMAGKILYILRKKYNLNTKEQKLGEFLRELPPNKLIQLNQELQNLK